MPGMRHLYITLAEPYISHGPHCVDNSCAASRKWRICRCPDSPWRSANLPPPFGRTSCSCNACLGMVDGTAFGSRKSVHFLWTNLNTCKYSFFPRPSKAESSDVEMCQCTTSFFSRSGLIPVFHPTIKEPVFSVRNNRSIWTLCDMSPPSYVILHLTCKM
jgi:hypothetical protein